MKKLVLFFSIVISFTSIAQIVVNGVPVSTITNSNVFLDASSSFSTEAGAGPNTGKGIVLPSVDLVNFAFDLTLADGFTFPTYFDGMVVYNSATGTTLTTGNRSSLATTVTPGFYYFSNPNGATNANVTGGVWKPLGGSGTASPVFKGTQATNGTNATFTINNSNVTSTSVVTVSYLNSSNEIISHAISAIALGSFTVQFAAPPASGGSILYTIVN